MNGHKIFPITKEQTNRHTQERRYTLAYLHVVQWLYFKVVKEVDLNESYPVVWFSGIDLTSFNAPSSPSRLPPPQCVFISAIPVLLH